jgi:hypothetical protein
MELQPHLNGSVAAGALFTVLLNPVTRVLVSRIRLQYGPAIPADEQCLLFLRTIRVLFDNGISLLCNDTHAFYERLHGVSNVQHTTQTSLQTKNSISFLT